MILIGNSESIRPKDELTLFQFGFANKSALSDVKLVDPAREIG